MKLQPRKLLGCLMTPHGNINLDFSNLKVIKDFKLCAIREYFILNSFPDTLSLADAINISAELNASLKDIDILPPDLQVNIFDSEDIYNYLRN